MSDAELASLADRLIDMVGDRAEAAVTVTRRHLGLTRFANSFIHQNVVDEHTEVALKVSAGGRPAGAVTYGTDDKSLTELAGRALKAASLRAVDPDWPGLAPPAALVSADDVHYDAATAAAGPGQRGDLVAAFVAAGEGLTAAGSCSSREAETFFANSAGQRVACRDTGANFDAIYRDGRSDAVASTYSVRLADIDGAALGVSAAGRARRGTDPIELPAGSYEVVLEPRCVADILDFYSLYAFNGKAVNEDRSFIRRGEAQFDAALSIWDDATDRRHLGPAFDGEGTPKRRTGLVAAGTVTGACHDRRTAAKAGGGAVSTAHAIGDGHPMGAVARNLFLGAGPGLARPVEVLVGEVKRGLLVSDLWYTRVLDPKTLVVTGLTRNGVFLIEDGEVGPAVSNLRFTQSYASALGPGHVLGVGADAQLAGTDYGSGGIFTPSLRLSEWHFTGNASS
jgi:predicted Zn-dependent protease